MSAAEPLPSPKLPLEFPLEVYRKYKIVKELASGKFGTVYSCTCKVTAMPCALKVMQKADNIEKDVLREVNILKKIDHPGILKMVDFMECSMDYILVTELLKGGELFDFLLKKDYLDEKTGAFYMKQIIEGTRYLHGMKIIHLDLKPENIVLNDPAGVVLKIIDFGTAQDLEVTPKPRVMAGTPEFIAPEVLNAEPATCAADMWAIGIIAYVLLTGMSPFLGDNDIETMRYIASGEFEFPDPDIEGGFEEMSEKAKNFIKDLILLNPKERADSDACLKHEFLIHTDSKRIATKRLEAFKARRQLIRESWIRAARMTIRRIRSTGGSSSSREASVSPGLSLDDVLEA